MKKRKGEAHENQRKKHKKIKDEAVVHFWKAFYELKQTLGLGI